MIKKEPRRQRLNVVSDGKIGKGEKMRETKGLLKIQMETFCSRSVKKYIHI